MARSSDYELLCQLAKAGADLVTSGHAGKCSSYTGLSSGAGEGRDLTRVIRV
jgi:hypothetical protein